MVSIRKQKNGKKYFADYYQNGKRIRKIISENKTIANQVKLEIQKTLELANWQITNKDIEFESFIIEYLKYSANNKKRNSHKIDTFVINVFKSLRLFSSIKDVSPIDIENFKSYFINKKLKPGTVNRYLNCIHAFFTKAEDWGYININPARRVKKIPLEEKGLVKSLSDEVINLILKNCNDFHRPIYELYLNTGLRRSELLDLKWENVNFIDEIILIRGETKSRRIRYVPMNDRVIEILKKYQHTTEYVLPRIRPDSISRYLNRLCHILKIKNIGVHMFRHTYASKLSQAGVDINVIRDILGHSSILTTTIYTHLNINNLKEATNKVIYKKKPENISIPGLLK